MAKGLVAKHNDRSYPHALCTTVTDSQNVSTQYATSVFFEETLDLAERFELAAANHTVHG
jgi:hypothetical protein